MNNVEKPLLSVLLPVHEGEDFLSEVLECVQLQTFKNFELIILDNLSTDNSASIIKKFLQSDTRIKYILDSKRRNGNDCFTELARHARGEYCIVINDDNIIDPNFFLVLVDNIKKQNFFDWVIVNGIFINKEKKKLKIFFNQNCYLENKPNMFKIIKFYLSSDVIQLLLTSICKTETYKNLLPYLNISKFENDADTIMGVKILSNLNIKYVDKELICVRVYDEHKRYHSFNIPNNFILFCYEKFFHYLSLLKYLFSIIASSKLLFISKITLIFSFSFLVIFKVIKNNAYNIIFKIKQLFIK